MYRDLWVNILTLRENLIVCEIWGRTWLILNQPGTMRPDLVSKIVEYWNAFSMNDMVYAPNFKR